MIIENIMSPEQARMLSPLQFTYVGDAVHSLIVREYLLGKNLQVKKMHRMSVQAVCAVHQNQILEKIIPLLSEEETAIAKRGRNAHAHHGGPKGATVSEYAGATGLEALIGYLFLTGNTERLNQLSPHLLPED